jgi:hypothetical protein
MDQSSLFVDQVVVSCRRIGHPPERETEIGIANASTWLPQAGSSANLREFITGSVPKEARRAVNRWKSLKLRSNPE